jgi:hypothetical protein
MWPASAILKVDLRSETTHIRIFRGLNRRRSGSAPTKPQVLRAVRGMRRPLDAMTEIAAQFGVPEKSLLIHNNVLWALL